MLFVVLFDSFALKCAFLPVFVSLFRWSLCLPTYILFVIGPLCIYSPVLPLFSCFSVFLFPVLVTSYLPALFGPSFFVPVWVSAQLCFLVYL